MDGDDVEERLEAVERALTDGDADLTAVTEAAERERDLEELHERVDDLESEVTELAASVQAVRGYVGNVRTVNRDVERRADAALAKVEELEGHRTRHGGRDSPDRAANESRTEGKPDDRPESPGDIARRIAGGDGHERDRRPPQGGSGGTNRERDGARGRTRSDGGDTVGGAGSCDDEDGFLSGLRDAL